MHTTGTVNHRPLDKCRITIKLPSEPAFSVMYNLPKITAMANLW